MNTKQLKTRKELAEMIMERITEHPEWNDIVSVAITETVRNASYRPNWDAAFTHNGQAITPDGAFRIITEFQNKYDLA
jgi:hypothetical protein